MNSFTSREAVGDLLRPDSRINSKTMIFIKKVRLDSKGRISLPVEVRRNFGLDKDFAISIVFSLDKNLVLLVIGQDSVADSMGACGKLFGKKLKQKSESLQKAPGRGSKEFGRPANSDSSRQSAIPRPDPEKFNEGGAKDG